MYTLTISCGFNTTSRKYLITCPPYTVHRMKWPTEHVWEDRHDKGGGRVAAAAVVSR
jgi:hypothetical protein